MRRRLIAVLLALSFPSVAVAGPLEEAVKAAGREIALAQQPEASRGRGRFWTGVALLAGGGLLTALGGLEIGDDEDGPDDAEDFDESDDGEDSDGVNKALLGGGIAAAALGSVLMLTGRSSGPRVSLRSNGVAVKHTVRF